MFMNAFSIGYEANLISTIVDISTLAPDFNGYEANLISTIVDTGQRICSK